MDKVIELRRSQRLALKERRDTWCIWCGVRCRRGGTEGMCKKREGRGGVGPARGRQGLNLQDKMQDRTRARPVKKAPDKGGQGPSHSHTVIGSSMCGKLPKEGGPRVKISNYIK